MALIRDRLTELLTKSVMELLPPGIQLEPEIEIPAQKEHGHYATNVAMMLARHLRKNPRAIAEEITAHINTSEPDFLEKVEIAGPGFINFFVKPRAFAETLPEIIEAGFDYGRSDMGKGTRIQVEFVSANPTGPLHIGHGRGAAVGDSLARILQACGYEVEREYYINDTGKQMEILGRSLYLRYLELLGKDVNFPDDHYKGSYMIDLARQLLDEKGRSLEELPEEKAINICAEYAGNKILQDIKNDLAEFRVFFDRWFSEKSIHDSGEVKETIEFLKQRGFLYEKEGATWFKSTAFSDEKDRVVVRSNGATTYFAADIAYHWNKLKRGFDTIIDIWGADHHGYVPRMKAAVKALGYNPEQLQVILVQLVNLLRAGEQIAMSTRAGKFVTLREVMDEVGVDAARYIFLTRRSDSHLDFDLEVAKQQSNENPVYYVQYAHARLCSIFEVARERGINFDERNIPELGLLDQPQETTLIQLLGEFPYVVQSSARFLEPHRISYYLHDLVSSFHSYYNHHRIIGENPLLTHARLYLARALQIVIKNALDLLGVSAPEKM
ncbi:MAG TPA: arginine--tRNA ligase [Thermodesulforhabdus norvegica]|uniref:Arginine--tRNA ligase n=1 Tax=Thermodesulforhabdus norvegica TaxID=39841 RepID=A0A7C0WV13_9BACT|nr:arginine--tRNA ligase [Thermodesulforhabdus norvegica]